MIKRGDKVIIKASQLPDTADGDRFKEHVGKTFIVHQVFNTQNNYPVTYNLYSTGEYNWLSDVGEMFVEKVK